MVPRWLAAIIRSWSPAGSWLLFAQLVPRWFSVIIHTIVSRLNMFVFACTMYKFQPDAMDRRDWKWGLNASCWGRHTTVGTRLIIHVYRRRRGPVWVRFFSIPEINWSPQYPFDGLESRLRHHFDVFSRNLSTPSSSASSIYDADLNGAADLVENFPLVGATTIEGTRIPNTRRALRGFRAWSVSWFLKMSEVGSPE